MIPELSRSVDDFTSRFSSGKRVFHPLLKPQSPASLLPLQALSCKKALPGCGECFASYKQDSGFMGLSPTIHQPNSAVEDQRFSCGILAIKREVTVAHKLEDLANFCLCQRWLQFCSDYLFGIGVKSLDKGLAFGQIFRMIGALHLFIQSGFRFHRVGF